MKIRYIGLEMINLSVDPACLHTPRVVPHLAETLLQALGEAFPPVRDLRGGMAECRQYMGKHVGRGWVD